LAIRDGFVFWTNSGSEDGIGTVNKVSVEGGTPTVLASNQILPAGIAVDDRFVYWADARGDSVLRVPIAGGEAKTIATNQAGAWNIVVTDTTLFWSNRRGGTVMRLEKTW
jgi:hypothetical protein